MKSTNRMYEYRVWLAALLLSSLTVACDQDPILSSTTPATRALPAVTAVSPAAGSTGIPTNTASINATFSVPMAPITGSSSFVVSCAAPCTDPAGTVALDPAGTTATFTLTSPATLLPLTDYTATVTGARSAADDVAIASPYVWHFVTGNTADTTRPTVTSTTPATTTPGPTTAVPSNTTLTAVFSEDMSAGTITAANAFTVSCAAPCTSPTGTATYNVATRTATFTPATALSPGVTYTATIDAAVADLALNGLAGNQPGAPAASDYEWTFTTVAPAAGGPPAGGGAGSAISVQTATTQPAAGATGVCPTRGITATFDVPSGTRLADDSVTPANFTITGPGPAFTPVTATSVDLDAATGRTVTFTPAAPLTEGQVYTATIKSGATGVADTATPANNLAADYTWTFTPGAASTSCEATVNLEELAPFAIAADEGITNTATTPLTTINGNVLLGTTAQCNAVAVDGAGGIGACGGPTLAPVVNGTVVSPTFPDAGVTSGELTALAQQAYLAITPPAGPPTAGTRGGATSIAAGTTLGAPAGSALVQGDNLFAPGVYQSTSSILITGDLTLDAQGDPDAVFIFQSSSTIGTAAGSATPGSETRILLVNGAKASNVWWQAATSATLGSNTEFRGNLLAGDDITLGTGATSCGRLMAGAFTTGQIAFDSNVVSVPGNGCPE